MTWPAEDTTIADIVIVGVLIQVVGFPIAITSPSPLVPTQRFITATTRVLMTAYSALTLTPCATIYFVSYGF